MSRVKRERFLAKKFLGKKNEALRFCGRRLNEGHCILHAGGSAGGARGGRFQKLDLAVRRTNMSAGSS